MQQTDNIQQMEESNESEEQETTPEDKKLV
jgi:hypothetical protein